MAQGRLGAEEGAWIESGQDHGKPVRYRVRAIPPEVTRGYHRQIYSRTKLRKSAEQSVSKAVEKLQDYTLLRAIYALIDTENFAVEVASPAAADYLMKALGMTEKPAVGAEVFLDGKWTDELKRHVLTAMPLRAGWLAKQAMQLAEVVVEEEEEEAADF